MNKTSFSSNIIAFLKEKDQCMQDKLYFKLTDYELMQICKSGYSTTSLKNTIMRTFQLAQIMDPSSPFYYRKDFLGVLKYLDLMHLLNSADCRGFFEILATIGWSISQPWELFMYAISDTRSNQFAITAIIYCYREQIFNNSTKKILKSRYNVTDNEINQCIADKFNTNSALYYMMSHYKNY
jgi:hypothetical protein